MTIVMLQDVVSHYPPFMRLDVGALRTLRKVHLGEILFRTVIYLECRFFSLFHCLSISCPFSSASLIEAFCCYSASN